MNLTTIVGELNVLHASVVQILYSALACDAAKHLASAQQQHPTTLTCAYCMIPAQ